MKANIISGLIVAVLLNIIVFPLILIWALNTLLMMSLDFSLINWFAAWMIISCMRGAEFTYKS